MRALCMQEENPSHQQLLNAGCKIHKYQVFDSVKKTQSGNDYIIGICTPKIKYRYCSRFFF